MILNLIVNAELLKTTSPLVVKWNLETDLDTFESETDKLASVTTATLETL